MATSRGDDNRHESRNKNGKHPRFIHRKQKQASTQSATAAQDPKENPLLLDNLFQERSSRPPRASQGQGFTAFSQLERLALGADFGARPAGWWRKWNGTRGELFPRVGFLVTNLKWSTKRVVRFYNWRGTAEQWIKEGKNAVNWTKLSCRRFKDGGIDCVGGKPSQ
jgi:hypothetical protein